VLSVRNLTVKDDRGVVMVDNVSFDVRAGEIVGVAGVAGNGQSELLEAIAGIRKPHSGEILLDGQTIDKASPARLRELGLAHIPEDRHHMGLVLKFEEYENSVLGYHRNPGLQQRAAARSRRDPQGRDGEDREIRHPAAEPAAEDRQFLRRQPAEDRRRPRDRARSRRR
jgi:ABC-type uncharacterized transport system ATPase subunit